MPPTPSVYTIAPGVPFVDALAAGLMARRGAGPFGLAEATVLLPTRRACRALGEAFLRLAEGRAMLLPRLLALGDVDGEEGGLVADAALGAALADIPPAIPETRRRALLVRLILRRAVAEGSPVTPAQAAQLARALARLIDQVQTERLSFAALETLVEGELARHWQITLDFLRIVTEHWPAVLAEEGCIDPAERRDRVLAAQAEAWRRKPPPGPVVAAGSTGSVPATADLLAAVAALPDGAVVLPGLDRGLEETARSALAPSHPQYGLHRLLDRLGVAPEEVRDWPGGPAPRCPRERVLLLREAMAPAEAPPDETPLGRRPALLGLQRVDCPTAQDEAGVVALILRHTLDTAGKTAALVTPDRGLGRRVAAELARWGIEIDDSAGRPLDRTPPGVFLRLTAALVAEEAAPAPLLAALKHPLAAGGQAPSAFRATARRVEIAALRGPRPLPGLEGLRKTLSDADKGALAAWVGGLARTAGPLLSLWRARPAPFADLLAAHLRFAEALAASDAETGAARLWAGDDGEAAALFVDGLRAAAPVLGEILPAQYPALLEALMAEPVVRPRWGRHPRLFIWGPLEARLQQVDLVVLGGLNEGTWPPEPEASPWLSRPMMTRFGLPLPERRVGLAAHDFFEQATAPEVVLTRAERVEGTPTVPSRWLVRLDNRLRARWGKDARIEAGDWLSWWRALDRPDAVRPETRPAPRPPLESRPRALSVTRVETWMRDPYAIYARYVLGLRPLEPLDAEAGAAERGTIVHAALCAFLRAFPDALPDGAEARLIEIGREVFRGVFDRPGVAAFWWPRFRRVAAWFVAAERARRAGLAVAHAEVRGALTIDGPAGPFRLTAIADRINCLSGSGLSIIDYKTGQPPTGKEAALGYAPQLALEAAIAEAGGFEGVAAAPVAEMAYWRLGGGDPPGEIKPLKAGAGALAVAARDGLAALVAAFDDPATPYLSRPDPKFAPRFSDYDHLARVKEWSAGGGEDGGE